MKKIFLFFLFSCMMYASVGYFVVVRGDVEIHRNDKIIKAQSSMPIQNQDKIITKGVAKAQIRFADDTVVTLGKNTVFKVENYINDKSDKKLHMGVEEGSFKVITGGIAKTSRNDFVFSANSAVIGVRGTIFAGDVGHANQQDIIGCVQGAIDVKVGNSKQLVVAGHMVEVQKNKTLIMKALDSSRIETINTIDSKKVNRSAGSKQGLINAKNTSNYETVKKATKEYVGGKKQVPSSKQHNYGESTKYFDFKDKEERLQGYRNNQESHRYQNKSK